MAAATSPQIAGSNLKTNAVPPSAVAVDQISGANATSSTLRNPRPLLPTLLFGSFGLWPSWQSPLKSFCSNARPLFATKEHRGRCGYQRKRDWPRIVTRRFRQGVMCVLQQLENAPTAIRLRNLPTEARDRPVLPRPRAGANSTSTSPPSTRAATWARSASRADRGRGRRRPYLPSAPHRQRRNRSRHRDPAQDRAQRGEMSA